LTKASAAARHGRAAEALHHARAGHQRHDLVAREHERRQFEALAQKVADPRLAVDRHARGLQVGDVAVDRAFRHLEPLGQRARRDEPAAAQALDDPEQAVGAAHPYRAKTLKLLPSGSRQ
jgi:hypothetical protein